MNSKRYTTNDNKRSNEANGRNKLMKCFTDEEYGKYSVYRLRRTVIDVNCSYCGHRMQGKVQKTKKGIMGTSSKCKMKL